MARADILQFLRAPLEFTRVPARPELWRAALDEVARPAIEAVRVAGRSPRALREAQVAAWEALVGQRIGLILGPPGTGKTFTLSWMALAYLEAHRRAGIPCRILITAFTRNAVINVLEGVAEKASEVLGIEVPIRFFGEGPEGAKPGVQYPPLKAFREGIQPEHAVIGCTSWGLYKALDEGWHGGPKGSRVAEIFDLVCIDEASQLLVPQALMGLAGLREGGRVLIAGDNKQLAPIGGGHDWSVDNRSLGGSVYDFLVAAKIPEQRLNETFRLNRPLSEFPSHQFYEGEYFSAAAVKERRLALNPGWEQGLAPWQRIALAPDYPVVILLYDGPAAGTRNQNEVELVRQIVEALWHRVAPWKDSSIVRTGDFWSEQLAVVSPHRAQNVAIRDALASTPVGDGCVVETVERIQGRERDTVVASYTVADPEFALMEAEFLFNPQRFNVSLTRARSKFILVMSRALLEVVPPDEGIFDAARLLREFVFGCAEVGAVEMTPRPGQHLQVTLRVRRFDESTPLPTDLLTPCPEIPTRTPPPAMTKPLDDLLQAIRRLSAKKIANGLKYLDVPEGEIAKELARRSIDLSELRALLLNGHITLDYVPKKDGSGSFWTATPLATQRLPIPCERDLVRAELARVVLDLKGSGQGPLYARVRNFYAWLDPTGRDILRPILDQTEREGLLRFKVGQYGGELVQLEDSPLIQERLPPPVEALTDADFLVLNALEDLEVGRINFGIFEAWSDATEVGRGIGLSPHEVAESLRRLEIHGYVMRTDEQTPRVRSRMAELGRELRYVKQRFQTDDANERPYLVRAIKVIARNRDKPERDHRVAEVFDQLRRATSGTDHAGPVLSALEAVLMARWGAGAKISGFQARAWEALIPAWLGIRPLNAAVITADTGAGKTEAAGLPLIFGAAVDAISGIRGVRAVLVYPRIRLAANQAQRLCGYMRELSRQEGMPRLTIGLQTGDVPTSWSWLRRALSAPDQARGEKLPPWSEIAPGSWLFPFFACPGCGKRLILEETGTPQDQLRCLKENGRCEWSFDGWVGTKEGLRRAPPHIFLPVTESLHQWMQTPKYGALFGDRVETPGAPAPPRAILADEIHLYSLVPGAQVGYALRRLLARMKANGTLAPLAIGMSATLGDPARVWSDLVGCGRERVLHIGPMPAERKDNPRGREYFYFVQPEVESRGKDIAGASTTIQSLMCLAHGMRRRTGDEGGFRGIVFLDSIDKVKRIHSDYKDAEENTRLARLRTFHQGEAPRCEATSPQCGQSPQTCDRFRDGECWFFAANDPAQWTVRGRYEPGRNLVVCRDPIYSGTRGNADEIVQCSDLVFSTSSLEVGFDDPDMTLVYQHYAPLNLASFIQRKGRGGRGADDRPITGVTLSVYSPRDTWYFRAPDRMLNAADFEVPLNVDNYFVRRGQVLSLLLDWAARWIAQGRRPEPNPHRDMEAIFRDVAPVIREVFGPRIYADLEVEDLRALWIQTLDEARRDGGVRQLTDTPKSWGEQLPQVPSKLFDPINLPLLTIRYPNEHQQNREKEEDVTLAFSECAPGKGTRRWGYDLVHWNPYRGPRAPLFPSHEETCRPIKIDPSITRPDQVSNLLPVEARRLLGADPQIEYLRPTSLPMEDLGAIKDRRWNPYWEFDEATGVVQRRAKDSQRLAIHHKSLGKLLGTVIVVTDPERALAIPYDALIGLTGGLLTTYKCHRSRGKRTGLRVTHAFWGSDITLQLESPKSPFPKRESRFLRQIFTHVSDPNRPILFGYGMESEGVCLDLDSDRLNRFIETEWSTFPDASDEGKWLRAQFFRYLIASGASGEGINGFQARHLAELIVSAAALPDLRARLLRCLYKVWSREEFQKILQASYRRLLSQSPVLTETRIEKMAEDLEERKLDIRKFLKEAIEKSGDETQFKGWLRTAVLHGLVIRLKQLFVLYGRGDESKVLLHARLPLQFTSDLHDRLTVCEKGGFGDGTTRTFVARAQEAFADWKVGGIVNCPNARADQAMEDAFSRTADHARWRALDLTAPQTVADLARDLRLHPEGDASALQLVVRLLYGEEEVYGERFAYYDLYREIRSVQAALRDPTSPNPMLRAPGTWELVGAVVHDAANGGGRTPRWARLLEIYGGLEGANLDESLAPQARLADQIYRISARLCPDGCQACLHLGSDLMDDGLAEMTVSRRVLERFWAFVEAESSASTVPEVKDQHLFSPEWVHALSELRNVHHLAVTPGRDIAGSDGRVVGSAFAIVEAKGGTLYLLDGRAPWASAAVEVLEAAGQRAIRMEPRQGADPILDALGG